MNMKALCVITLCTHCCMCFAGDEPTIVYARLHGRTELPCRVTKVDDIIYARWTKNGTFICHTRRESCVNSVKYSLDESATLTITDTNCSDGGLYECHVKHKNHNQTIETVEVSVYGLNTTALQYNGIRINGSSANINVTTESNLELTCLTSCKLAVDFAWFKNDVKWPTDDNGKPKEHNCVTSCTYSSNRSLKNVGLSDGGNYTCRASHHGLGVFQETSVFINVNEHEGEEYNKGLKLIIIIPTCVSGGVVLAGIFIIVGVVLKRKHNQKRQKPFASEEESSSEQKNSSDRPAETPESQDSNTSLIPRTELV